MSDDFPLVRSKADIIQAFFDLAKQCEENTNPEDVADRFDTAFKLILEARVPQAENNEELGEMIQEALDDPRPSLSMDETFERLEQHRRDFSARLKRFLVMLSVEAWESAAMMIAPTWKAEPNSFESLFSMTTSTHGYDEGVYQNGAGCIIHHPLSSGGGPLVKAYAPYPGLAMLAAICRAHASWPELNKR